MPNGFRLPDRFEENLGIAVANSSQRLSEAAQVGNRLAGGGIPLKSNPDHFATFADPPQLLAGPLKRLGYVVGADNRCYPSPVDGCDYINVAASLPLHSSLRESGWPDHIAVVHPVDDSAYQHMSAQNYGNPFIHHITFGIELPDLTNRSGLEIAERLVKRMVETRERIAGLLKETPGTLIVALPSETVQTPGFAEHFSKWIANLDSHHYQLEEMEGGGYLLQFFVLSGGRIEVALRHQTRQTFNPRSVRKISEDELSVDQN